MRKYLTGPTQSSSGGRRILVVGEASEDGSDNLNFEIKVPGDRGKKTTYGHREPIFQPPHGHTPVTLRWQDDFFVPQSARGPASHLAVPGLGSACRRTVAVRPLAHY